MASGNDTYAGEYCNVNDDGNPYPPQDGIVRYSSVGEQVSFSGQQKPAREIEKKISKSIKKTTGQRIIFISLMVIAILLIIFVALYYVNHIRLMNSLDKLENAINSPAAATFVTNNGKFSTGFTGYFFISSEKKTWHDARKFCRQLFGGSGRLLRVRNLQENAYFWSLAEQQEVWIGANDLDKEGQFIWDDGCPFNYTNWGPRLDNWKQKEHCAHIENERRDIESGTCGKWNDWECNNSLVFICQKGYCKDVPIY